MKEISHLESYHSSPKFIYLLSVLLLSLSSLKAVTDSEYLRPSSVDWELHG